MESLIGLIIFVTIIYFVFVRWSKKSVPIKRSTTPREAREITTLSREEILLNENSDWLDARWEIAKKERDSGKFKIVPKWYFKPASEAQLERLERVGLLVSEHPTAGQISDLYGLFHSPEEKDEKILKFFKIPLQNMNRSKARHQIALLLSDPEKYEQWENRSASQMEKEFYRFFDLKIPKGLTHQEALKTINSENNEKMLEEWEAYENIYDEIDETEFREDHYLKKISLSIYRSAIEELKKEGNNIVEIYNEDDMDVIVDKIVELKPEIEK